MKKIIIVILDDEPKWCFSAKHFLEAHFDVDVSFYIFADTALGYLESLVASGFAPALIVLDFVWHLNDPASLKLTWLDRGYQLSDEGAPFDGKLIEERLLGNPSLKGIPTIYYSVESPPGMGLPGLAKNPTVFKKMLTREEQLKGWIDAANQVGVHLQLKD